MALISMIGVCRMVIEGGLLYLSQGWGPHQAMAQLTNAGKGSWFSLENGLVPISFFSGLGALTFPSFIQSFKVAHDRKINARPLLALIFAVIIISMSIGLWRHAKQIGRASCRGGGW